jgi:hypothetical protein
MVLYRQRAFLEEQQSITVLASVIRGRKRWRDGVDGLSETR